MSQSYLVLVFLLYNAYYLKSLTRLSTISIVKRGATVITQFLVIPQNSFFFQKNKKNKKIIKAGNAEKPDQERLQNRRKSSCNFRKNLKAQVYAVTPKNRKMQIQRSNEMNIGRICIKIKSNDIIKFLIGQFDLIMGQIEF
jgi:hypothetical protein